MKQTIFILSILFSTLLLNANEFSYIKPVAVEEAPAEKYIEAPKQIEDQPIIKQKEAVEEIVQKEQKNDTDQDGIIDEEDRCPNTSDGIIVNERGCEVDSDDDGVVDSNDQCPNTSKEFVVDGYGCPQTATLKVHFPVNSYAISEQLIDDLEKFAKFLQDNIGYQIIIYGYTDSDGNDELNKELSQNRANTIKEALIRYGIKEIRLTSIGKGSKDPVADNSTSEGRAANRRIEVELLK